MLAVNYQGYPCILWKGWLCMSPKEKNGGLKLFRSQWKKRFFVVLQNYEKYENYKKYENYEKYELIYRKDEHSYKKKGSIDLGRCNEVIESVDSKFFPNLLALKTWHKGKTRMYYLAASSQAEMKECVRWLCFACGMNTPPQENQILELNPALDYLSPGQGAGYPENCGSRGVSGRHRNCSRVFSRVVSSPVEQERVPGEVSKQDGDTPLAAHATPFKRFMNQQISETFESFEEIYINISPESSYLSEQGEDVADRYVNVPLLGDETM